MARATRLESLDVRRLTLEVEYERLLIEALRQTGAGSWGLFDHNQSKWDRKTWGPTVKELQDIGNEIDQTRERLGLEEFVLHQEFEAARGPVASNAPGEPKQAKAWLERLGISL